MVSSWNFTDRLGLFEAEPATADALDSAEVICADGGPRQAERRAISSKLTLISAIPVILQTKTSWGIVSRITRSV